MGTLFLGKFAREHLYDSTLLSIDLPCIPLGI